MNPVAESICQSCGMPLGDPHYLGSNIDGSPSVEYCHYCFKNGHFTDEGISMDEKIQKIINIAIKSGMSKEAAIYKSHDVIPHLKRWRQN